MTIPRFLLKRNLQIVYFLSLFLFPASTIGQQVILSFYDGFLGDQDGNGCVSCTNTSTLGITNLRFGQISDTGQFTAQGNDIVGYVTFTDADDVEHEIEGNIQYRITNGSTLRAFGFVPTNANPVTIATETTTLTPSGTFEIFGIDDPNASTFGFIVTGQEIILNNEDIKGNAATSGLVDELNIYLADQVNISISDATVNEGDGTALITVSLSSAPSEDITVNYATQDSTAQAGSDYTTASGTIIFPASSSADQTFTVPLTDDSIVEEDEFFYVQLSNPTGGAGVTDSEGIVTIQDNDSVQNENLTLTLTQRNCWRFLSSPLQNLTYNNIIDPLWTQGVTGSDSAPPETETDFSNIYIWDKSTTGNTSSGWITSGLDLDTTIPAGEGFLMSIFEDDNYDGTIEASEQYDKEISVSGTAHPFDAAISPVMNTNADGWTLVGNPFNDGIDFGYLVANSLTTELTDVAYVYNVNGADDGLDNTNGNPGGWVTTDGSIGDLHDGKIAVFQGFFVQNISSATNPGIIFNNASRITGAAFYGKEKEKKDFVRLELKGDNIQNSAWLTFSDQGSSGRVKGDAFELVPFKDEYVLFGTKKGDEILDIGQFPREFSAEVNLHVETTLPGKYSIQATDLNLSSPKNLVFRDKEKGITIPVDENFSYSFSIQQVSKSNYQVDPLTCGSAGEEMAKTFLPARAKVNSSSDDRFSLYFEEKNRDDTETPEKVRLNQNYPNPFNPATRITYQLPQQGDVLLEVYDLTGKLVKTLVNEAVSAGVHHVTLNASSISSGVYIYRLQTGNIVLSRKLTVIK